MGLHAFTEYLKYRWKARGRHGTHSPFVYALVEDVLQGKDGGKGAIVEQFKGHRHGGLLSKIAAYYNYNSILNLDDEGANGYDMVLLPEATPGEWVPLLHKYTQVIEKGGVIVVPSIHKTKKHTENWGKLCADEGVKLSIDLYGMGLLFSKEEFKEKQHFVLKAPSP